MTRTDLWIVDLPREDERPTPPAPRWIACAAARARAACADRRVQRAAIIAWVVVGIICALCEAWPRSQP